MKTRSDAILKAEQASYLERIEPRRDPLLETMEAEAAAKRLPISDPEVASLLAVAARASGARRIVELGTNIGYGAIVLARAAGPDARVVTIEHSAELCATARRYITQAGLDAQIEVRHGEALAELAGWHGEIDLAYIDCVKEEYLAYLELLVPKLRANGVIIADNVLWRGYVALADDAVPADQRKRTALLREFNARVVGHPQLRGMILPIGDGVAYAVKQ